MTSWSSARKDAGGCILGRTDRASRGSTFSIWRARLDRLGIDYIDLYRIHRWDDQTPIEETLSALDHLVDERLVRCVGASSMAAWKLTNALYTSDVENFERFVSMQPEYSLVRRYEEHNVLPVCEAEDIGVIPWSPLHGGFLTGKTNEMPIRRRARDWPMREPRRRRSFSDAEWDVLDAVREIASEDGVTPVQVSIAWLLHKDVVTASIDRRSQDSGSAR